MITTKDELILQEGLKDGLDEERYAEALRCSGLVDLSVSYCFRRLIKLEKDGMISLSKQEKADENA